MASLKLWHWQALTADGQLRHGERLAFSRQQLEQGLIANALIVLSLKRRQTIASRCWRLREQVLFLRQLSGLLQAGITLVEGIELLAHQHPLPGWRALLTELAAGLRQGAAFSETLAPWQRLFSPLMPALLRTGELTGRLEGCCLALAERLEQRQQLADTARKALRYPLISLGFGLLVAAAMIGWVLPQFTAIYQSFDAPLPWLTQMVLAIADRATRWAGPLLLAGSALGWLAATGYRRHPLWQRRLHALLLRLPLVGPLVRGYHLSQIYTTLALTQQSGIPLLTGLEMVIETLASPLWCQAISQLRDHVAAGSLLSAEVNNPRLFTPLCAMLLRVGEESGTLDQILARLASWHTTQAEQRAAALTALMSPLVMALTGVIIGVLLIAMYLPVFQLGDAMSMG